MAGGPARPWSQPLAPRLGQGLIGRVEKRGDVVGAGGEGGHSGRDRYIGHHGRIEILFRRRRDGILSATSKRIVAGGTGQDGDNPGYSSSRATMSLERSNAATASPTCRTRWSASARPSSSRIAASRSTSTHKSDKDSRCRWAWLSRERQRHRVQERGVAQHGAQGTKSLAMPAVLNSGSAWERSSAWSVEWVSQGHSDGR